MKLSIGTQLKYNFEGVQDTFVIVGTRLLRGIYFYIFTDSKGKKQSLSRSSVLDAINRNVLEVLQ